jgi:prevent-host-death family protein
MSDPVTLADARDSLGDLVNRAHYGDERVLLTKRGKPVAAIVSLADLDALEAYESAEDEKALKDARAEDDGTRIPLEDIIADHKALSADGK